LRFLVVGTINTFIDFYLLSKLTSAGLSIITSNTISTSVALIFSFFANKKFTFKNNSQKNKQQFALFILISLTGLWIIQPIIITLTSPSIYLIVNNNKITLLTTKAMATCVTLIWNYLLYNRFVFKNSSL